MRWLEFVLVVVLQVAERATRQPSANGLPFYIGKLIPVLVRIICVT